MPGDLTEILSPLMRNTLEQKRRADIQNTGDYGPTLAELYSTFNNLPGLRGLWLPGSQDQNGAIFDSSGQGRTLTRNGTPTLFTRLSSISFENLNGTTDYYSRANEAGLDIVGNEAIYSAALRGLTVGGWFLTNSFSVAETFVGRATNVAATWSFLLYHNVGTGPQLGISNGVTVIASPASDITTGWQFLIGRFVPSTSIDIYKNGNKLSNTSAVYATLNNPAANFTIGAASNAVNFLVGDFACAFLCACALDDLMINYLFARTRVFFGK